MDKTVRRADLLRTAGRAVPALAVGQGKRANGSTIADEQVSPTRIAAGRLRDLARVESIRAAINTGASNDGGDDIR